MARVTRLVLTGWPNVIRAAHCLRLVTLWYSLRCAIVLTVRRYEVKIYAYDSRQVQAYSAAAIRRAIAAQKAAK